jgi:hypothetical protein
MSIQNINRGTTANDGNGDPARAAALKINENFAYLLNAEATFKLIEGTAVNRESLETDVAAVINAGSPFTLAFANFAFIKYFEIVDGDIENIYFFKIMQIGGGDKTFGNGGAITLASENLFLTGEKLKSVQDFEELNTTVTEDFRDIGSTSVINYVNGLSPALAIQATSVGATIIRSIVSDVQESYLFKGEAGDYGQGELQLEDTDLEALAETTQVSVVIDTVLDLFSSNPVANKTLAKEFIKITTDINKALDNKSNKKITKLIPGTTYTIELADQNFNLKFVQDCNVVVPLGLPADVFFQGEQRGAGVVRFSSSSNGTLQFYEAFEPELAGQFSPFGISTHGNDLSTLIGTLKLAE